MTFAAAFLHAFSSLEQGDIILKKEQRKLSVSLRTFFSGGLPGLTSHYVSKFFPFCLTTS